MLAANGVEVMIDQDGGYTPTPVISHAILTYNRGRTSGLADGIVITPSHNPPEDGGIKYNPPHGGPADTAVTTWIEDRANALLATDLHGLTRLSYDQARRASTTHQHDYLGAYISDLAQIIHMDVLRSAGLKLGIDPLGGSGVAYWQPIAERYGLNIDDGQSFRRSDLPLHATRLGRQDSYGLLFALCHGESHRAERSLRCCLWQRCGQ